MGGNFFDETEEIRRVAKQLKSTKARRKKLKRANEKLADALNDSEGGGVMCSCPNAKAGCPSPCRLVAFGPNNVDINFETVSVRIWCAICGHDAECHEVPR